MKIIKTDLVKFDDRREATEIEILGLKNMAYLIQNDFEEEFGMEKTSYENVTKYLFYSDKAVQTDIYLDDMKLENLFMVDRYKDIAFGYATELDQNYKETDNDFIVMISL